MLDAKAMCGKADLFGVLNPMGGWCITALLRRVSTLEYPSRPIWIVFDGDVDPEWAENLNSVLDDNRLLTLPSGERLALPPQVRLIFETCTLEHATLATVSRTSSPCCQCSLSTYYRCHVPLCIRVTACPCAGCS